MTVILLPPHVLVYRMWIDLDFVSRTVTDSNLIRRANWITTVRATRWSSADVSRQFVRAWHTALPRGTRAPNDFHVILQNRIYSSHWAASVASPREKWVKQFQNVDTVNFWPRSGQTSAEYKHPAEVVPLSQTPKYSNFFLAIKIPENVGSLYNLMIVPASKVIIES